MLAAGLYFGGREERRHYRSIRARESEMIALETYSGKRVPPRDAKIIGVWLATGSVVLSIDRFKQLLAGIRRLFGGPVHSYSTLIDRARREALLRMKEDWGYTDAIFNVRIETSTLSSRGRGPITIEAIAYGTAVRYEQ